MLSVLCEHLNIVPATAAQGTLVRNFTVKESFSKWMLVSCGLGQGVWLSNVLSASGFIFKKKTKLFRKKQKGMVGGDGVKLVFHLAPICPNACDPALLSIPTMGAWWSA